jgi:hypothetical protein
MKMISTLKSYEINIGGDDWGMNLLCDTLSQALSVASALEFYYKHEKIDIEYLEIEQQGRILEKII